MVRDERVKQVGVGLGMIALVILLLAAVWFGRFLPGLPGEWFERLLGLITTPFIMEGSFALLGLCLVIGLNLWRLHREGDEFVYLEEVKDAPANLPDQAHWAVYRQAPLPGEEPPVADRLEGALAIGDHPAALELLAELSDAERSTPEILALRLRLARETGHRELAERLERELQAARPA